MTEATNGFFPENGQQVQEWEGLSWKEESIGPLRLLTTANDDPDYVIRTHHLGQLTAEGVDKLQQVLPDVVTQSKFIVAAFPHNEFEKFAQRARIPQGTVGFATKDRLSWDTNDPTLKEDLLFDQLPIEKRRGIVHELSHVLAGANNLPFVLREGIAEVIPRILLGMQNNLPQSTQYITKALRHELVSSTDINKAEKAGLFTLSQEPRLSYNSAYMSAMVYAIGVALQQGKGDITQGITKLLTEGYHENPYIPDEELQQQGIQYIQDMTLRS